MNEKRKLWEAEQIYIRDKIVDHDLFNWEVDDVELVAGVDISFSGKF